MVSFTAAHLSAHLMSAAFSVLSTVIPQRALHDRPPGDVGALVG